MRTLLVNLGDGVGDKDKFVVPTVKQIMDDGTVKEFVSYKNHGREELFEHLDGNVYLPLDGRMHVIRRGEKFEVSDVEVKAIMNLCPHLVRHSDAEFTKQKQAKALEATAESAEVVSSVTEQSEKPSSKKAPRQPQ